MTGTYLKEAAYKGIKCVEMENEWLRAIVIPESGGKIQSLYDKKQHTECLYQTGRDQFIKPSYGISFDDGDLSGFDDMFPTISSCYYPEYPWQGCYLPDHGEVWSVPWDYSIGSDFIELYCYGIKIPYKLIKRIYFSDANRLKIDYQVTNNSPFAFKFIWAAHPLINIDEFSEVLLPGDVEKIFHTYNGPGEPNAFGRIGDWSTEKQQYGAIANPDEESCGKFYVYGKMHRGECAAYNNKTHHYIKFFFPVEQVPYFAVWLNWNGYSVKQKNMALEPCTGALDSIDVASKYGWISEVQSKDKFEWYLEIETGTNINKASVISRV